MPNHSPIGSCCARPRFSLAAGLDDRRRAGRQAPSPALAAAAALRLAMRWIVGARRSKALLPETIVRYRKERGL